MKTLKVNQIEKNRLSEKEMAHLRGGERIDGACGCGCKYADNEGSSIESNGMANADHGYWSGDKFVCIQTVPIDKP